MIPINFAILQDFVFKKLQNWKNVKFIAKFCNFQYSCLLTEYTIVMLTWMHWQCLINFKFSSLGACPLVKFLKSARLQLFINCSYELTNYNLNKCLLYWKANDCFIRVTDCSIRVIMLYQEKKNIPQESSRRWLQPCSFPLPLCYVYALMCHANLL